MIFEEELGQGYNPKDEDIIDIIMSLLMITVGVTVTLTYRAVFIIVTKKEKKQFFSFS